ncbi:MAG: alanine racemase [Candidatus Magasanikbacteria bacterium]
MQEINSDPRTKVEISENAIENNFKEFKEKIEKNTLFGVVVKSNAYGHGIVEISQKLDQLGADWFIVSGIHEAINLRENGIKKPILILGYTPPRFFKEAKKLNVRLTAPSKEFVQKLIENGPSNIKVHLKINTGMNRRGIKPNQTSKIVKSLLESKVTLEGFYTHLAEATTPNHQKTDEQLLKFKKSREKIRNKGVDLIEHAGATAGSLAYPESELDMVRVGIGLYGLWPSKEIKKKYAKSLNLEPTLEWKTFLAETKNIKKGEGLGYGFTEKLKRDSQIGIVPIGYWHGYPIQASRKGSVLIHNKKAKVMGRVSMDSMMIDITDIKNPQPGDEVTLVGPEKVTASNLAEKADSINYEIVTSINPAIRRVFK